MRQCLRSAFTDRILKVISKNQHEQTDYDYKTDEKNDTYCASEKFQDTFHFTTCNF